MRDSAGLATALNPSIGYENVTLIAREAVATGRAGADLVLERELLSQEALDPVHQPEVLTRPHRDSGIAPDRQAPDPGKPQ